MKKVLNGFPDPLLPELRDEDKHEINCQAAEDFSKRSVPGSFIILLALIISVNLSNVFVNYKLLIILLFSVLLLSIFSRFFIIRSLPKHKSNNLKLWKQVFSIAVLSTASVWGIYMATIIYLYGDSMPTMIALMFTVGIAGGSAISLFIWKNIAHSYLLILFLPTFIISLTSWNSFNLSVIFAFTVYFIFLYFQIVRSNKEYWVALYKNKLLEEQTEILEKQASELIISKDEAEKATQIKSEFLANMSHEIRTPLNAILGFIDLLKEKEQDDESRNYLDTIDSSSYTLLGIINDILDFSKIESGKLAIDSIAFNPFKEFNTLADLFKARCSEKNLSFEVEISDQLPSGLKTDILRLRQIITNLLSNAIKFTKPDKTVSLIIDYSQGYLNCSVKDEGIGMTLEAQSHIFDAFTQAETSTTRKFGGTGLGLAISSRLVKILGGRLKLESELNKGSHFYFSIPAQQVTVDEEEPVQSDIRQSFHGHILLVEDNKVNQMLMSALLKKSNLTFDIADDGLHALSAFQSNSYDLILMDENMPNLNGIKTTKKIRSMEQGEGRKYTPIVALTANAMIGDRERFLQSGMDEYLTKPVNRTKLLEVFTHFLKSECHS